MKVSQSEDTPTTMSTRCGTRCDTESITPDRSLRMAADTGDLVAMRATLDAGATDTNWALLIAAKAGQTAATEYLLQIPSARAAAETRTYGWCPRVLDTALAYAAEGGHEATMVSLRKQGATGLGTALTYAAASGQQGALALLYDWGAARGGALNDAIYEAERAGQTEAAKILRNWADQEEVD